MGWVKKEVLLPHGDSVLWICWCCSLPSRVCKLGVFCHWVCILCWMAVFEQVSRTFPLKVPIYSFVGFPMLLSQFYCSGIDVKCFQVIKGLWPCQMNFFQPTENPNPCRWAPTTWNKAFQIRPFLKTLAKWSLTNCIFETGDEKEVVIQEETTLLFSVSCIWVLSYLSCSWTCQ